MKEQRSYRFNYFIALAVAVAIGGRVAYQLALVVMYRSVENPVAYFIDAYSGSGRILLADLDTAAKWLLPIGYAISALAMVVIVFVVVVLSVQIVKAEIFSNRTMNLFRLFTIGMVGYFAGQYFELLGANFTAYQFNAQVWFEANKTTTSDLLLIVLFIICATFIEAGVRRGIRLQEEQEGLV